MPAQELIQSYLAYLRKESCSKKTIKDRLRILTLMDAELPVGLDLANADELEAWLWRDGWSEGTRETYYYAFRGFFSWAAKKEILDFNPAANITPPKVPKRLPRPITDEQLTELLSRAAEPYRLWVVLASYGGLRCLDISRLHREHVNELTTTITRSKGGKARVVPTHEIIWEAVRDLPPGPITEHDPDWIAQRSAIHFGRSLRMRGVTLHRCRHWFGTMVQRLHKDLRVTQELMGHASPSTTAGYAMVAGVQTRAAIDVLPRFDVSGVAGQGPAAYLGLPR